MLWVREFVECTPALQTHAATQAGSGLSREPTVARSRALKCSIAHPPQGRAPKFCGARQPGALDTSAHALCEQLLPEPRPASTQVDGACCGGRAYRPRPKLTEVLIGRGAWMGTALPRMTLWRMPSGNVLLMPTGCLWQASTVLFKQLLRNESRRIETRC